MFLEKSLDFGCSVVSRPINKKNNFLDLDGATIRLFTKKNMPISFSGPMIAAYIDLQFLSRLVSACPDADIIYVPWTEEERDEFAIKRKGTMTEI